MVFGDNTVRCWKQIIYFKNDDQKELDNATHQPEEAESELEELLNEGDSLISDERGVRIARNESDDGD
jgi:cyanophycin synthetase